MIHVDVILHVKNKVWKKKKQQEQGVNVPLRCLFYITLKNTFVHKFRDHPDLTVVCPYFWQVQYTQILYRIEK